MQNKSVEKKIYKLPEIKSRYSSRLVSKVVSITFLVIAILLVISAIVVTFVRINVTIDASGLLEPTEPVYLHSPLEGEIKKVFAKGGVGFKKGDLLIEFDSIRLNDQIEKLKSDLAIKKIDYKLKLESIPLEVNQNEQKKKQAEAQLLKAKANLRDKVQSFFPGANIDSLMNTYKKGTHIALDYALSDIISAEVSLDGIQSTESIMKQKKLEEESALLEIKQIEKNIERQSEYLMHTKVIAPFDGIMLTEEPEKLVGSFVNEGTSLVEICMIGSWKAYLSVGEKDVYELSLGDSVKIEVKAMKQSEDYMLIPGKVTAISAVPTQNQISQTSTGQYRVEVIFDNKITKEYLSKFKKGFTIDAKIIKETDKIINVVIKNIKKIL